MRPARSHLINAAATLQAILSAKHPRYSWIVTVRPDDGNDRGAPLAGPREISHSRSDGEQKSRAERHRLIPPSHNREEHRHG